MYKYFKEHPQDFLESYHKRSNVETTFYMIKQKFGSDLKTKSFVGQQNEILCKVLSHNICCLIAEYFAQGLNLNFSTNQPQNQVLLEKADLIYKAYFEGQATWKCIHNSCLAGRLKQSFK